VIDSCDRELRGIISERDNKKNDSSQEAEDITKEKT
jgi:hypothetical protein